MLLHRSIGLERFNSMSRSKAIHALYECCNHFTLATKLADARPFLSHDEVYQRIEDELGVLSVADQENVLPPHKMSSRLAEMLGPVGGWPEYAP